MLYKSRPNLQFAIVKKDLKKKKKEKEKLETTLSPSDLTYTFCIGRQSWKSYLQPLLLSKPQFLKTEIKCWTSERERYKNTISLKGRSLLMSPNYVSITEPRKEKSEGVGPYSWSLLFRDATAPCMTTPGYNLTVPTPEMRSTSGSAGRLTKHRWLVVPSVGMRFSCHKTITSLWRDWEGGAEFLCPESVEALRLPASSAHSARVPARASEPLPTAWELRLCLPLGGHW